MSLRELARSIVTDRHSVSSELEASHAAFVAKDCAQSDDVLKQTMGSASASRYEIEGAHREIATRLVPSGVLGMVQDRHERAAGVVAGRLYGSTDAEIADALSGVPGIDSSVPPRHLGKRALWIRDLVEPAMRSGSFDPAGVTDAASSRSTVEAERREVDSRRIEVRFAEQMGLRHPMAVEARYGVPAGRVSEDAVRLDAWRRELSAARGDAPSWTYYDAARAEYSKAVSPGLPTGVPESARFEAPIGMSGRRLEAGAGDAMALAREMGAREGATRQSLIERDRAEVDRRGRPLGGPVPVLKDFASRLDVVTMFDPRDGVSKSVVDDARRSLASAGTRGRGPSQAPEAQPPLVRTSIGR